MEIAVVTKVPDPNESGGNLALGGLDLRWVTGKGDDHLDETTDFVSALTDMFGDAQRAAGFVFNLRAPVFSLGEVLILDERGREVGYPGRKPDKWLVEVVTVSSLEEARDLAEKVMG